MAEYNRLDLAVAEELRAIVGERRFQYGEQVKEEYAHDEMPSTAALFPRRCACRRAPEEVSAIMKICHKNRIPVTVRGAGTGLVGGCVPGSRRRGALHGENEPYPVL